MKDALAIYSGKAFSNIYERLWLVKDNQWINVKDGRVYDIITPLFIYSYHDYKLGSWFD